MLLGSVVGSLVIAAMAGVYLYEAIRMPMGTIEYPGVGFVPVLFGTGLLVLCFVLVGEELLTARSGKTGLKDSGQKPVGINSRNLKRMSILILSFLLFPLALSTLGFLVATSALLLVSLRIMQYKKWIHSIVVALAATFMAHFLFVHLLGLSLPTGLLWSG